MADATNVLAEGEVQQLMNVNDPDTTEESYMRVIYSKTARLFEVAAQSVAIVAGAEKSIETAFQEYGRYLGTAFQLVDDVLAIMAEHKSLDYAMDRAKQEAKKAVDAIALLPESEYKKALISLAYLSVDRTY